jgi:hypothetical protein
MEYNGYIFKEDYKKQYLFYKNNKKYNEYDTNIHFMMFEHKNKG